MASEVAGLYQQEATTIEFLNYLRKEISIQSDAQIKFTLQKQIAQKEAELSEIRKKIKIAYGLDVFEESTLLDDQIKNLDIDVQLGEIHLVNCDRGKVRARFWDAFDRHFNRENPFQFYYVLACPSQQPTSFGERMIYEVIDEELDGDIAAISYVNRPNSRRVKIEDLPLGRNLRNSQKDFKKYFTRRFNIDSSFETYLRTGLPKLEKNYDYIVTVFDLNASKWNQELMEEYMQWIIDVFSDTHEEVPQFLFFFAIFLKNVHLGNLSGKEKETLESISQIIGKNEDKCTLLDQLLPVPVDLLEDWIRDLGEQNQSKVEDLIKAIVAGLPKEKQEYYLKSSHLDMSDIERFQEIVYKIANE